MTPQQRAAIIVEDILSKFGITKDGSDGMVAASEFDDMKTYTIRGIADLLDRLSAQAQGSGTPFAYAYEYPTYDGPVIRFETNGRKINGSKPTRAIPLYTHPSAGPAVSGPSVEDVERIIPIKSK